MTGPAFFPASTVATLRRLSEANLPYSCAIQSRLVTQAAGGTHLVTWNMAATVACRLAPLSATARERAAARDVVATYVVVLPAGTALTDDQRLVVTGTDAGGAAFTRTLSVVQIEAPQMAEAMRRVLCTDFAEGA